MDLGTPQFWIALLQIIGVNIVLSGDNAVVIALAARSLPDKQRKQAVVIGSAAAVLMRITLTVVAVEILRLPYLKLIGAALLLWIGVQLLAPEGEDEAGDGTKKAAAGMATAVRTILLADLVMSLDNVIAVAAAAKGSLLLLVLGLLISIPLVIFGSTLLMKLMDRWPIIVTIGAALLGWVAGEMAVSDPSVQEWIDAHAAWLHYGAPTAGALLIVIVGKGLAARAAAREVARPVVDLATASDQGQAAAATVDLTFLFSADDSDGAIRAAEALVKILPRYRDPLKLHLLNVQPAAHGDVGTFVGKKDIADYHHEQGLAALKPVREIFERARIPYIVHIGVGDLPQVIAHYAKQTRSDQIFVGVSAGRRLAAATAGLVEIPVTLMR
ncbi:MAG: TerC family protein [Xanthobacteraceae bacterium]